MGGDWTVEVLRLGPLLNFGRAELLPRLVGWGVPPSVGASSSSGGREDGRVRLLARESVFMCWIVGVDAMLVEVTGACCDMVLRGVDIVNEV